MKNNLLCLMFSFFLFSGSCAQMKPENESLSSDHIYLTWNTVDTSSNIVIKFHTPASKTQVVAYYDKISRGGKKSQYRHIKKGKFVSMAPIDDRNVHSIELDNLTGGEVYHFILVDNEGRQTEEKKFKSIPNDGRPINFIVGGDMGVKKSASKLLAQASKKDPYFALIGGDIAYGNGKPKNVKKWDQWLKNWQSNMVTEDGFMVPMVLAVGNHEVRGAYNGDGDMKKALFYSRYFNQDPKSYFVREFNKNTVIFVLDSGHVYSHASQREWLKEQLKARKSFPNKFALYHVPLFPSHGSFEFEPSKQGRQEWMPLFDEHNLKCAFEHHGHTLKRTKLIKAGRPNSSGTLYLGDGAFGKRPNEPRRDLRYLAKVKKKYHFWHVEINGASVKYSAIDQRGNVVDSYSH